MSTSSGDPSTGPAAPGGDDPLVRPLDHGAGGEMSSADDGLAGATGAPGAAGAAGAAEGEAGDPGPAVGSAPVGRRGHRPSPNMLPPRQRRRFGLERILVRLIATGGIIGIGVVIAAIMSSNHSHGWIIGIVVSAVSVILAAILWSSRQL